MEKKLSGYIGTYKKYLEVGEIQVAYEALVKYVMSLKSYCEKAISNQYTFGNVSPGYMDFTYFPFFDDYLRSKKLRFGIVLNHKEMRFELWLMGQNIEIQRKYWDLLKRSVWNKHQTTMPKYSVLETILVKSPNFDNLSELSAEIEKAAISVLEEILEVIHTLD